MTLTRTWSAQAQNQTITETTQTEQCQQLLYAFKRFIVGANPAVAAGAWTVDRSSDGSANAGAADYWAASTNIVWAAAGSNHSWIVFKSPAGFVSGGYVYLLIDCQGATVTSAKFEWASAAYTGGSLTAAPTSTASQAMGTSTTIQWHRTTSFPFNTRWHGSRNSVGDFVWQVSRNSAAYAHAAIGALSTTGFEAGDTYPAILFCNFNDAAPGALARAQFNAVSGPSRRCTAFWYNGGVTDTLNQGLTAPSTCSTGSGDFLVNVDVNGSDITGAYYGWDAEVVSCGTAKIARRGRLCDVTWANYDPTVAQGTATPSDASPERCIYGAMWLPSATKPTF